MYDNSNSFSNGLRCYILSIIKYYFCDNILFYNSLWFISNLLNNKTKILHIGNRETICILAPSLDYLHDIFWFYSILIHYNFRGWNFTHPKRKAGGYSMRLTRVGKNSLFSREVLYSLLLTNVLSLLLGCGFG